MRKVLPVALVCLLFFLFWQVMDSCAIKTVDATETKTVDSLIEVSHTLTNEGNYDQALEVNAAAEQIALEKLGRQSAAYGAACDNHGRILTYQGIFTEAEKWYLEAKDIQEKALGKSHPNYAVILNNLATLYSAMGDYGRAEPLFLEAKAIWEKALGKENNYSAWSAESLGTLYHRMNNYEKADLFYSEANRIRAKTIGKQHPDYATTLCSQASLCVQMGNYKKAEALYLEAKDIQEKALGKLHPDYAHTLDGLAVLYDDYLKDTKKAELLYLEVKSIREQTLTKNHPDYGWSLGNLGNFYWYNGNCKAAEPLLLEANALWERTLGKTHPNYVWSLHKLWALYWSLGDYAKAEKYGAEMSKVEKDQLRQATHYLSANELSSYIRKFQDGLDEGFSFAGVQASTVGNCYDNVLFYKGFLLNAIAQVNKLALADKASAAKFDTLKSCERRLAAEYTKLPAQQENVAELEEKANVLEKDLTRRVAGFGEALLQVSWQDVQRKLHPGEVAIEFVHYKFVDPRPTDSIMYAAMVLRAGKKRPVFIPLFEEKQLLSLLQIQETSRADYINALYSTRQPTSLYKLIWQPLARQLTGVTTIYFSPSGLLHYLNLGAIPIPNVKNQPAAAETLANHYHLFDLSSTRLLAVAPVQERLPATTSGNIDALLYGDIQYEIDSTLSDQPASPTFASERGLSFADADSTLRGGHWNSLDWTDVEVSIIADILQEAGLQATVRRGYGATEESFKAIGSHGQPSPRILHLATHGFFFPDPKNANGEHDPVFKLSDHPMIRSGLVLAGGNYAWQTGHSIRQDRDDGILTAYEISQMNLRNTELVVLSACETGLGDIQGNEGVYGLQRAFKIAGVKYLIMSLWQVPDHQTQELMTTFYAKWLEDKMSVPNAFRAAQKAMQVKYKSPFYWAGFVLVE